jgi:SAM-dependent methyltransferase
MIETWSHGIADENMPEAFLVDTFEKVKTHPWWLARARIALATLQRQPVVPPATVADVGCGWGTNLDALERAGYQATGFDISRRILQMIDGPQRRLVEMDLNQAMPANHPQFDALLSLDVLEHLDDDRGALVRMSQMLRPGGKAIISVPALPELFSEFDEIQGHRRRYLPETLRKAFDGTGLKVQQIFWWGGWMIPILRRMRPPNKTAGKPVGPVKTYTDYLRLPPWPGPLLMRLAYRWEHASALNGRLKTGTSLFAVAMREG